MARQRLLVVIPALNEAEFIASTVKILASQVASFPGSRIIVADGGSSDGTIALAKALECSEASLTVIHNPKRLQAAAVNLAVKEFGGQADVLVGCDAHAVYPADYLESLVACLERTDADTVVVSMSSSGTICFQKAVAWISDTPLGSGGSAHRAGRISGFVDHGHHAAFRMEAFTRVGGYNESFACNEDAELDCRLGKAGVRIYLDAAISITYYPRPTLSALARQYYRYGRGRAGTFIRHPSSLRFRQALVPLNTVLEVVALIISIAHPLALLLPAAYIGILVLFSMKIAFEKRSLCGLAAGLAGFAMHQSWAVGFLQGVVVQWPRAKRDRPLSTSSLN